MEELLTTIFSVGAIVGHIFIVAIIALYFVKPKHKFIRFLGENGILVAFTISMVSMLASLYYSEVVLLEPCVLCWYQRIFAYGNVFILGTAFWQKKPQTVLPYGFALSSVGALIAIYHVFIQFSQQQNVTCSLSSTVSCSDSYITMFGYITIPVLSLTAFVSVMIFLFLAKKYYDSK